MGDVLLEILAFVACGTGEIILYVATLGRHKPQWPHEAKESRITRELAVRLSTCVGIISWGAVLVLIAWLVSR